MKMYVYHLLACAAVVLLLAAAAGPVLATWNWTTANPAVFEFDDKGTSSYSNPNGNDKYTTYADPPNGGANGLFYRQQYTSGGTWVHQFSDTGDGSLTIQTNSAATTGRASFLKMRGQASHASNCETFRTSVLSINWGNGIAYEASDKSVGDKTNGWPSGYSWGGSYGTGGIGMNFWNLGGVHGDATQDAEVFFGWKTNDPTSTTDDTVGFYRGASTPTPLVVVNYSLGGTSTDAPDHVYRMIARRSPLPWAQTNDQVLVNAYVDGVPVIANRTVYAPSKELTGDVDDHDFMMAGTFLGSTNQRGDMFDYLKMFEPDAIVDTDLPTMPFLTAVGGSLIWTISSDPTTSVIGYRIKKNGSYLAYTEWVTTNYNDAGYVSGDAYQVFAVDAVGNESPVPEPSSLLALACGLTGFCGLVIRRRR